MLKEQEDIKIEIKPKVQAAAKLKISKTLAGNLVISDHKEVDIVIDTKKMKISIYPKDKMSDRIYTIQDKILTFLVKKGILEVDSIRAGNVYNSLEGNINEVVGSEVNSIQVLIYTLSKFLNEELEDYDALDWEELVNDRMTDPEEEESTELGAIPLPTGRKNAIALYTSYLYNSVGYR